MGVVVVLLVIVNFALLSLWRHAAADLRHAMAAVNADDASELVAYSEKLRLWCYTRDNDPPSWTAAGLGVTVQGETFWHTVRRHKAATEALGKEDE